MMRVAWKGNSTRSSSANKFTVMRVAWKSEAGGDFGGDQFTVMRVAWKLGILLKELWAFVHSDARGLEVRLAFVFQNAIVHSDARGLEEHIADFGQSGTVHSLSLIHISEPTRPY